MELMVALVIGFIILGSIMLMTTGSNFSGQRSGTQSRMDEDAQLVLSILGPQIRMAGYSAIFNDRTDGIGYKRFMGPAIRGCDNGFSNVQQAAWRGDAIPRHSDLLTCNAGGAGAAISILYEADALNTVPNAAGAPTDCLGRPVGQVPSSLQAQTPSALSAAMVTVVENRYYLQADGATRSLMCVGNGNAADFSNPEPLISNIEALQVLYGVSTTEIPANSATNLRQYTTQVAGYLSAAQIDQQFNAVTDPDNDRWMRVVNVKLCVTVRSETEEAGTPTAYVGCNGQVVTPNDKYLRRTAQATFALRNRSGGGITGDRN